MNEKVEILSQFMTFMYLNYEFGHRNFKVTTVLEDGCWANKVILEATDEFPKDDKNFERFYKKALDEQDEK